MKHSYLFGPNLSKPKFFHIIKMYVYVILSKTVFIHKFYIFTRSLHCNFE